MNLQNKYNLLYIIHNNGSVNKLTRNEVTYEQIAEYMHLLIEEKLIEYRDEKIVLTTEGLVELNNLEVIYKKTNKKEWIQPDVKSRIAKLEKNSIFVPMQNELTF